MTTQEEINKIDNAINQLKYLKRDLLKREKLSDALFDARGFTPKRISLMDATLNRHCMNLDIQRKDTWKAIQAADVLEVDTEQSEYHVSAFHHYKR